MCVCVKRWQYRQGRGLVEYHYLRPGVSRPSPTSFQALAATLPFLSNDNPFVIQVAATTLGGGDNVVPKRTRGGAAAAEAAAAAVQEKEHESTERFESAVKGEHYFESEQECFDWAAM